MNQSELVSKLWNLCRTLRDDGITYHQYVTELTYLLFLKMAQGNRISKKSTGSNRLKAIYGGAYSNIESADNLKNLLLSIDQLDWYSASEEGLGDLYEGILEKNAGERKAGAGQYFTPRVVVDVVTALIAPQQGERCNDPACGTFGFMVAADAYIKRNTNNLQDLTEEEQRFQREEAFSGGELVSETYRLALMNAMLHRINGMIQQGDTLSSAGKRMKGYDVVLTNPPFGLTRSKQKEKRDDLPFPMSNNKQLNFLQHIYGSLRTDTGTARAAVILPDNVLFADGDGEKIRKDLMEKCNLHTILRLPAGIFYAPGIKTNVLFFSRGKKNVGNTKEVWFYDMRTDIPVFGKRKPLIPSDFDDFIECYRDGDIAKRKETYSEQNPRGRWRRYTYEELLSRDKLNLDITWMREKADTNERRLDLLVEEMEQQAAAIQSAVAALKCVIREAGN